LGIENMAVAAIWIASDRIKIIQMNTTITADLLFRTVCSYKLGSGIFDEFHCVSGIKQTTTEDYM
jgi:hypothetical protein